MQTELLKPLDDIPDVIQLIAGITNENAADVHRRLMAEAKEIGTNVLKSLGEQRISRYVASDQLDEFYRDSDAFLYETTVWNTCRVKQEMRDFIGSRLKHMQKDNSKIFCFGDGLGFDSAWLAQRGHDVSYLEPSLRCQQYAQHVFSKNEVEVTHLPSLDEIAPASLDVIVCLDVLEHVPQPQNLVKLFASWLKPDGVMFVHAPFWAIHWSRPTHLKENRHLTGNLQQLYTAQGLRAIDSSIFWAPVLLQQAQSPPLRCLPWAAVRLRLGQLLLKSGRWNAAIHMWVTRQLARTLPEWSQALAAIDVNAPRKVA